MAIGAGVASALAAAALSFVTMAEHCRSLQTSAVLGLYLLLSVLFDIAKTRSYYLRIMQALAALSTASVVLKITLLALLEVPKKRHIIDERKSACKEALAGFWSRTFFVWLNPTFAHGFRNIIKVDDLPALGPEFASELLFSRLEQIWGKGMFTENTVTKAI